MVSIHAITYTFTALILLTSFGNFICRCFLIIINMDKAASDTVQPAGRIIGWLERSLFAIGILTQKWEVFAAVIALKTIARFREFDEQEYAEYFLIGSLFSMLWAIFITGLWLSYDRHLGSDLQISIRSILETATQSMN